MSCELKYIQVGQERGDCTASYIVELKGKITVKELIDEILNRKEWGTIRFYSNEILRNYDISLRYRYDEIESAKSLFDMLIDDIGEKEVIGITADGGWSLMDYVVIL